MKKLAFTGHRDRLANPDELRIATYKYRGYEWVHGGAVGFDTQVNSLANVLGVKVTVIRPDYKTYPSKGGPLLRNEEIIKGAKLLIALYDGREKGGTYYTIEFAKKLGVPVHILTPERLNAGVL